MVRAPRFVSFALTNLCDLRCPFCYAPKQPAQLDAERVLEWCHELDENGCLGVGFGGGEPTLSPGFAALCQRVSSSTNLSVSFTTHANRFTSKLRDELRGSVHFIRVSMDGVGATYERIRGRSFADFQSHLEIVRGTSAFGMNYVVNDETVGELNEALELALTEGAKEFLLLPERSQRGLSQRTQQSLCQWIAENQQRVRLSISEAAATEGIPLAEPFIFEKGTRAYIHVNAAGEICSTSYNQHDSVPVNVNGLLAGIAEYEGVRE